MPPIRIVLCRPSHPGNIGAAARAMKAMGLSDLRLVAPERYPVKEDQWMATNAVDVLHAAKVHATLNEAISDCVAAFALSARPREWSPQVLDVRTAAARDRKSTRLNSSHLGISYAVFCLKKKITRQRHHKPDLHR